MHESHLHRKNSFVDDHKSSKHNQLKYGTTFANASSHRLGLLWRCRWCKIGMNFNFWPVLLKWTKINNWYNDLKQTLKLSIVFRFIISQSKRSRRSKFSTGFIKSKAASVMFGQLSSSKTFKQCLCELHNSAKELSVKFSQWDNAKLLRLGQPALKLITAESVMRIQSSRSIRSSSWQFFDKAIKPVSVKFVHKANSRSLKIK